MKLLDLTLPTPEENLALDEALLDEAEEAGAAETLRFWESPRPFVVLGYGKKAALEADLDACRRDDVPVLRRASGGGTVLQGPGCLNYALVLDLARRPELKNLQDANRRIIELHAGALNAALEKQTVRFEGHSDLVCENKKVSGNAQRRKRRFMLFHGTFLYKARADLMEKYLRIPEDRPAYRADRAHTDFVGHLPLAPGRLRAALTELWKAISIDAAPPILRTAELVRTRYSLSDWNLKY